MQIYPEFQYWCIFYGFGFILISFKKRKPEKTTQKNHKKRKQKFFRPYYWHSMYRYSKNQYLDSIGHTYCTGCRWQVFGSDRGCSETRPGAAPCWTQPVPVHSSWLQWTHHWPSVKLVVAVGKHVDEKVKNSAYVSHHATLFLIGNKLISPKLSLFCLGSQLVSDLPALILTHELCHLIFFPFLSEEGERESGWLGVWQLAKVNPPHLHYWIRYCFIC